MNKQNTILWFAAIFTAFLAGYIKSVTDVDFPVSGTIGIEGNRITYWFEKKAHIKDSLEILIRTDLKNITGQLNLIGASGDSTSIPFSPASDGQFLKAYIPVHSLPRSVTYSSVLEYNNRRYTLPYGALSVTTLCVPKIPHSILSVFYITLYLGLILGLRTVLEVFTDGTKSKKLALFTLICFSLYGFFIVPVINLYELNAVNKDILPPEKLFSLAKLSFSFLWMVGSVLLFKSKYTKHIAALLGIFTLTLFFLF